MMKLQDKFNEYILQNSKATYYRVKKDLKVEYIEPSFVFEFIYFKEYEALELELKKCYIEKEKKISRMANLDIATIEDRLFRSLVNKDKYHSVDLANELMLRSSKSLYDILYKLSYISEDENKLIKTYLFEYITNDIGYNKHFLKNLIKYFISSYNKYMDISDEKQMEYFYNKISKLYVYVYNKKAIDYGKNKLEIIGQELNYEKKIIYDNLIKGME